MHSLVQENSIRLRGERRPARSRNGSFYTLALLHKSQDALNHSRSVVMTIKTPTQN